MQGIEFVVQMKDGGGGGGGSRRWHSSRGRYYPKEAQLLAPFLLKVLYQCLSAGEGRAGRKYQEYNNVI